MLQALYGRECRKSVRRLSLTGTEEPFLNSAAIIDEISKSFILRKEGEDSSFFEFDVISESLIPVDFDEISFAYEYTGKDSILDKKYISFADDVRMGSVKSDFVGLYSSQSAQPDCIFPLTGRNAGYLNKPVFLAIPETQQVIVANGHFIKILEFSNICTPKNKEEYTEEIERLYEKGQRQVEEGVFEAAEITFSKIFNLSQEICDYEKQIDSLFYIGESRFFIRDALHGNGLTASRFIYEIILDILPDKSLLRERIISRLNQDNLSREETFKFDGLTYGEARSIQHLERVLSQSINDGNQLDIAHNLRALGQAYHSDAFRNNSIDSYALSLSLLEQALEAYGELGETSGQAAIYHDLGDLQRRTGHYTEAVNAYESAYDLYQITGESEKVPLILLYLGDTSYILGEDDKALSYYSEIINICREINGDCLNYNGQIFFFRSVSEASEKIGRIYFDKEQYDLALEFLRQAANRVATNYIGYLYTEQGNYSEAIRLFQDNAQRPEDVLNCGGYGAPSRDDASIAASIRRGISESEMTTDDFKGCIDVGIDSLLGQADAYRLSRNYWQAVNQYRLVLETIFRLREIGYDSFHGKQFSFEDRKAVAQTNMGLTYKALGEHESSLRLYRLALSIRQEFEDGYGQAVLFNNIGEIYRNQGDYAEAEAYYQQALALISHTIGE